MKDDNGTPYIHIVHDKYTNMSLEHTKSLCIDYDGNLFGGSRHDLWVTGFNFGTYLGKTCPRCLDIEDGFNLYGFPSSTTFKKI